MTSMPMHDYTISDSSDQNAYEASEAGATITIITSTSDKQAFVGKRFTIHEGAVKKEAAAAITQASVVTVPANTAQDLAAIIESLSHRQAIILGAIRDAAIGQERSVVTKGHEKAGQISRSLKYFGYQRGPGWLLLDLDLSKPPQHVLDRIKELGGLPAAVRTCWPKLTTLERLSKPSSSAGIRHNGQLIAAVKSFHVYVKVTDVSQSKAILEELHTRAWALGLGWIALSSSGGMLDRSIFDTGVASPERIVFETPPLLDDGITRDPPQITWHVGAMAMMPEGANHQLASDIRKAAKEDIKPEAQAVQDAFVDKQADRIIKQHGVTSERAREIVLSRIDGGILEDDDVLETASGHITVAEMLQRDPDQVSLPDPIEGRDYGRTTATYFGSRGSTREPFIVSHAHGLLTRYYFARYRRDTSRPLIIEATQDHPRLDQDADDVAGQVREAVVRFLHHALNGEMPQSLLAVDMGIGKTRQTIEAIANLYTNPANADFRILVRVPTHALANEWLAALTSRGVTAGVYRGIDQTLDGQPMCQRADDVAIIRAAGGSVADACGTDKKGYCPHHPKAGGSCLWRSQDITQASVAIIAGDVSLTRGLPEAIKRHGLTKAVEPDSRSKHSDSHFNALIIDESSPTEWIIGGQAEDTSIQVGADLLQPSGTFALANGRTLDDGEYQALTAAFSKIRHLIEQKAASGARFLTASDLASLCYSEANISDIRRIAWKFKPDLPANNHQAGEALRTHLAETTRRHRDVMAVHHLLKALAQAIQDAQADVPPNASLQHIFIRPAGGKGGTRIMADLAYRADLADWIKYLPVAFLDATAEVSLLRRWFANLEPVLEARACDGPGARRIHIIGDEWPYSTSVPSARYPDSLKPAMERMRRAFGWAIATASLSGGQAGFVGPKAVIEAAQDAGLSHEIITANFGGLRGVNALENVASEVVYGRQLPPTTILERLGGVAFGKPISPAVRDALPTRSTEITIKGKPGMVVETTERYHPMQEVDVIIETTARAERKQAEARCRPVRRGIDRPVIITVLGSGTIGRPADVVADIKEWNAATHRATFLFLLAGIWPVGRGRAEVLAAAIDAIDGFQAEGQGGCSSGGIPKAMDQAGQEEAGEGRSTGGIPKAMAEPAAGGTDESRRGRGGDRQGGQRGCSSGGIPKAIHGAEEADLKRWFSYNIYIGIPPFEDTSSGGILKAIYAADGCSTAHLLKAKPEWWRNQTRSNSHLAELVSRIDEALASRQPVEILGVAFPTAGFHRLTVKLPGSRYGVVTHVRASSLASAMTIARAWFAGADISASGEA